MGQLRGGRHLDVERDEQVERLHGLVGAKLVGPGGHGVRADADEGADLAVAGGQNLLGEGAGGRPDVGDGEVADAQLLAGLPVGALLVGLGHVVLGLAQHGRVGHPLALAHPAPADGVDGVDEVLGDVGVGREVGARARGDGATLALGEDARGALDVGGGNAGALLDVVEREWLDGLAQLLQALHVGGDEVAVDKTLGKDDAEDAGEEGGILARLHLQEDVGLLRSLGAARVDDDELHASLLGLVEALRWVVLGNAAPHGDGGVGADQHPDVGVVEHLGTGAPVAVVGAGDGLGGLVDGAAGIGHVGANAGHEGAGELARGGEGEAVGAAEGGDGARAVLGDDGLELVRHLVDGLLVGDVVVGPVGGSLLGVEEAIGVVVLFRELASFDAGEPLVHLVLGVAADLDGAAILDVDLDRAEGVAEAAEGLLGLDGHGNPPERGGAAGTVPEAGSARPAGTRARSRRRSLATCGRA